jgi:serine/threonine-protein kinase
MRDVDFLALLVHRGMLARDRAAGLLASMEAGAALDELLVAEVGWDAAEVQRLRRTRADERPEIPGYELRKKLGTGGTANVFLARDKRTNRCFAFKVLKRELASDGRIKRAFVAEACLLERLAHPGLVRGFGVARAGDVYFSRLELVEGSTLLELLERGQRFSEDQALAIVLEMASVLRYLESQGVAHRDVKPGNIMREPSGRLVLIDLGFAAAEAAEGASVGTVAYLSPERACGDGAADIRSDIYSLGISLFHLAVGRLPFQGSDDREVLRMQVVESLSSPELKSRGFSPHFQYFVEKMMAKDKEHRYQGWDELIEDVRAQLAGKQDLDFNRGARGADGRAR